MENERRDGKKRCGQYDGRRRWPTTHDEPPGGEWSGYSLWQVKKFVSEAPDGAAPARHIVPAAIDRFCACVAISCAPLGRKTPCSSHGISGRSVDGSGRVDTMFAIKTAARKSTGSRCAPVCSTRRHAGVRRSSGSVGFRFATNSGCVISARPDPTGFFPAAWAGATAA